MSQEFTSVWTAIEDNVVLAENLRLRSQLMMEISEYVKASGLMQGEAAAALVTTQPRLSDVLNGHIEHCTLDRLVNMLAAVGFRISMQIDY
jgi:predicted XRE-type DNA-binding protein